MRIKKLEKYADKIKNKQKTMKTTTGITKENEIKNHNNRYANSFYVFFILFLNVNKIKYA